jgi:hypothetical protein
MFFPATVQQQRRTEYLQVCNEFQRTKLFHYYNLSKSSVFLTKRCHLNDWLFGCMHGPWRKKYFNSMELENEKFKMTK